MSELHEGCAQFYKFFWGRHEKPNGDLFNNLQKQGIDTSRDFSNDPSERCFWETCLVETVSELAVNAVYNRAYFWWPPGHPRSKHKEDGPNPVRTSKSWMNECGYGVINRSENPKNNTSQFRAQWHNNEDASINLTREALTHYMALPISKGGFQPGDHLWLDAIKPIRAVYFPVLFDESETYSRYENHDIEPDVSCPKGWRKPGQGKDKEWEVGKEGFYSWEHTLVIDVIKYMSLATVPYGKRKAEPITAVKYTKPHAIQDGELDWNLQWDHVSVSWETVQSFETGKKIKEVHPPQENYIASGISVISLVGFIPIVGPVLTKGLGWWRSSWRQVNAQILET